MFRESAAKSVHPKEGGEAPVRLTDIIHFSSDLFKDPVSYLQRVDGNTMCLSRV